MGRWVKLETAVAICATTERCTTIETTENTTLTSEVCHKVASSMPTVLEAGTVAAGAGAAGLEAAACQEAAVVEADGRAETTTSIVLFSKHVLILITHLRASFDKHVLQDMRRRQRASG